MKTKTCSKCKIEKNITGFPKRKTSKDGMDSWCKKCMNKSSRKYRKIHKQKIKTYNKKYRETHQKELKMLQKKYYQSHKDK